MKKPRILLGSFALGAAAFAAPASNDAAAESARFAATTKHLDLGGATLVYNDFSGVAGGVAELIQKQWEAEAKLSGSREVPPNLAAIVAKLGLADIEAAGFSSKASGDMYANKAVVLTKSKPAGLLTALGPVNRAPLAPTLAPANTHLLLELDLNGTGVKDTLLQVYKIVDPSIRDEGKEGLDKPIAKGFPLTKGELFQYLTGKVILGLQFRENETLKVDGGVFPAVDGVIVMPGRPALVEKLRAHLDAEPEVKMQENATFKVYTLDIAEPGFERYKPLIAVRKADNSVFLCSNKTTLNEWVGTKGAKLKDVPDFRRICGESQEPGVALAYLSPTFATTLRDFFIEKTKQPKARQSDLPELLTAATFFAFHEKGAGAQIRQLDNGLAINAHSSNSLFATTLMSIANVATEGFIALHESGMTQQLGTPTPAGSDDSTLPDEQ